MAILTESANKKLVAPSIFDGAFRHPCRGCGVEMIVPDPTSGRSRLGDGDIWGCLACGMAHEYYLAYGDGSRSGVMRALVGPYRMDPGEPGVGEFVEKVKP